MKAVNNVVDTVDDTVDTAKLANRVEDGADLLTGVCSKNVDDLLGDLLETTNGKGIARNFESSGGYRQTLMDFDSLQLSNIREIQTKYGIRKVGILKNGGTVVARPGSNTGGATLEITISNTQKYKIRY